MAVRIKGSSKRFTPSKNEARKVMVNGTEYDLSNISELSAKSEGSEMSTLTIENNVVRQGAGVDTRSVYEKAHSKASGRFTVTIPFPEDDAHAEIVAKVSNKIEEVSRSRLQKFVTDYRIAADREQLIRSEAYRRAKRDATYDREMSEEERDRKIGDLMPKRKAAGRFDLQVRMSVKDSRYDRVNSTAWRDTDVGRVGTYNQYGVGTVPLTNKAQVNAAVKISEEMASIILPAVAGKTDIDEIWNALSEAVDKLKVSNGYDPNATIGYTPEEEAEIDRIKLEMISRLGG